MVFAVVVQLCRRLLILGPGLAVEPEHSLVAAVVVEVVVEAGLLELVRRSAVAGLAAPAVLRAAGHRTLETT